MAKRKKTYRVSGTAPVYVEGVRWAPDEVFEAVPAEVAFLVEIGAVKASTAEPDDKKK